MLAVTDLEIRVGARTLMSNVSFRVDKGDKIGLVGRNGAGKTTLTKILAGDGAQAGGTIQRIGEIGYLPQDPRSGDPEQLARTRILDARGLGRILTLKECQKLLDTVHSGNVQMNPTLLLPMEKRAMPSRPDSSGFSARAPSQSGRATQPSTESKSSRNSS